MRRRVFALGLFLLPALVACGGKATTPGGSTGGGSEPVVLAQAAGGAAPQGSTAPVAAAPAPAGGQVLVMEGLTPTTSPDGSLTVVGKVLNTSGGDARAMTIVIELLDASGQRVGRSTFASPGLPTIKPGDRVAWQGRFNLPPKDWATVRATITADTEPGQ